MKHDIRRMALAAVIPLFLLFILYILKFLETGMDWNFTRLGVYPMEQRGLRGRGYIDLNFLFYVYPDLYYPLDYDTYFKSKDRFVMVTSNCLTGKAEYFE